MQNPDATPRFRHPAWGRPEDPAPLAEFPLRERVLEIWPESLVWEMGLTQ